MTKLVTIVLILFALIDMAGAYSWVASETPIALAAWTDWGTQAGSDQLSSIKSIFFWVCAVVSLAFSALGAISIVKSWND
jgi:hypothetical protein